MLQLGKDSLFSLKMSGFITVENRGRRFMNRGSVFLSAAFSVRFTVTV